ncbi:MAG: hypothetical protein LBN29_11330 [Mediterranea sp.]|jgi:hypothetical protein|nr:hypothetical protein [Mediterranea sp.]
MLFDRDNNGAKELRELTGNYFANNDFSKVAPEIGLATEELGALIGPDIVRQMDAYYNAGCPGGEGDDLLRKLRRPIAIVATLRMYRKNDLSHEDDGRKFKLAADDTEKLPWEWQLDRDDAIHLEEYHKAVDTLIRHLNRTRPAAWMDTPTRKLLDTLAIRDGETFDAYFPIDRSERLFLMLAPFVREAQALTVRRAYGPGWDALLADDASAPESDALYAARKAVALLAMSMAIRRLPLGLIPGGVVRNYAATAGAKGGQVASLDDIRLVSDWLAADAATWIDEMKRARDGGGTPAYDLLPRNHHANKYCQL